jgi:hypothetical protein
MAQMTLPIIQHLSFLAQNFTSNNPAKQNYQYLQYSKTHKLNSSCLILLLPREKYASMLASQYLLAKSDIMQ